LSVACAAEISIISAGCDAEAGSGFLSATVEPCSLVDLGAFWSVASAGFPACLFLSGGQRPAGLQPGRDAFGFLAGAIGWGRWGPVG
jgi:hypothetical protein